MANKLNDFLVTDGEETRRTPETKQNITERKNTTFPIGKFDIKDGETQRVFLLTTEFAMIQQHKQWERNIFHTCRDPKHGTDCYSCLKGIPTQKRALIPVWNVDYQEIQVIYATIYLLRSIYTFIDEYEEDSTTTPLAISRYGSKKDTRYSVTPARIRPAERERFKIPKKVRYEKGIFLSRVIKVPQNDEIRKMLMASGVK